MTTSTPNLGLLLYNSTTDSAEYFSNFRAVIAGTSLTSNFYKIDTAWGDLDTRIDALEDKSGAVPVLASFISANFYESTVVSITAYTTGMLIVLSLDTTSSGTVTLNINSLGTKSVMKVDSTGTAINLTGSDLVEGRQYLFIYDGTRWLWVSANSADQIQIVGTSGNVVTVGSTNNLLGTTTQTGLISDTTHAATAKTTPSDADEIGLLDSLSSYVLKRLTWANIKATLKTYFDSLYPKMSVFNITSYGAVSDYNFIADAAMGSGSSTLTSSSSLFAIDDVGKHIAVQGAGSAGAILYTTISAFTSSNSVTLTNSNASGGAISGKNAEWGEDNTVAIQAAIDAAIAAGGMVYVPKGIYMTQPLDLTDSTGWSLVGDGVNSSKIYALPHSTAWGTSGHVLDMTGTHDMTIKNIQIGAYNSITEATTAIACMQTAANLGNAIGMEDVYITGSYTASAMYVYGVPSSSMVRCKIYNYKTSSSAEVLCYTTDNSVHSLTSSFATVSSSTFSTSDWNHFDTELHRFGGNTTNCVLYLHAVTSIRFYGGVISGGSNHYVKTTGACGTIIFSGTTFETEGEPTPVNIINNSVSITGLTMDECVYVRTGEFVAGSGSISGSTGGTSGYHFTSTIGGTIAGGATSYFGLAGSDATENNTVFIAEREGILTQLRMFSSASPGTSKTYTYMLRINDADSVVTCSHTNASTSSTDLTHYVHVVKGTYVTMKFNSTAAANATRAFGNIQFIPF